ncbi:MAG: hypothetical protein QM755_23895 [Luteolibacter sp.]
MKTPPPPLVRARDIAKHFAVTEACISNWARDEVIPCVRIQGTIRFNFEEVLAAVAALQPTTKPAR